MFNFLLLFALALTSGCRDGEVANQQRDLQAGITAQVEAALSETSVQLGRYAEALPRLYRAARCLPLHETTAARSSVYLPRSAVRGHRANCFIEATHGLERDWQTFYERTGYVSWIYAYDSDTRVKRILPSANTRLLFGENLIFDSFSFYQDALATYPRPGWTPVKEDINGTGRIVIATQAIRLPESARYTVISIDVRLNQLLKDRYPQIQAFAQRNHLGHVFVFSYYRKGVSRTLVSDFSTDLTLWNQLKPQDNQPLHVSPEEAVRLERLEEEASAHPLSVQMVDLTLRGDHYRCGQSQVKSLPVFFLLCSLR